MRVLLQLALGFVLFVMTVGCASMAKPAPERLRLEGFSRELQVGDIVDTYSGAVISFEEMITDLAMRQVVYVGETHSSVNDHRIQKQILEALFHRNQGLVVGMEMFPRSVQPSLDRWTEGGIEEEEFLKSVDWERNWGFPVVLYRPLLDYCRTNHIRILALNAPPEIVRNIARRGLDQLDPTERALVATDFDFTVEQHRETIRRQYEQHRGMLNAVGGFDFFYEAQLAWEETMAETLAADLIHQPAPEQILVIIGIGHVEYGFGVPARTFRRYPHTSKMVVPVPSNTPERILDPSMADYLWITPPAEPFRGHRGRLGVRLEAGESDNGLKIAAVLPDSPAAKAGIQPGDILIRIDDTPVAKIEDVHKALTAPGPDRTGNHQVFLQRDGVELQIPVTLPRDP
jgi:uncharacterized iron-regulated protein